MQLLDVKEDDLSLETADAMIDTTSPRIWLSKTRTTKVGDSR